ncbi:MAG TPA: DUF2304 domain-containing protein [Candidatus Moranbacteria bacterium]|nr:DUF2304 domain-containing protein [Candidatus Moranbacteria bacterium]
MSILNIFVLIFIIFAISRVLLRFNSKELSFKEMFFWLLIWSSVLVAVIFPKVTTDMATFIGIGRGADSAFFISILLLFYLIFRLYVKIDNADKDITELSIKLSKTLHSKKNIDQ